MRAARALSKNCATSADDPDLNNCTTYLEIFPNNADLQGIRQEYMKALRSQCCRSASSALGELYREEPSARRRGSSPGFAESRPAKAETPPAKARAYSRSRSQPPPGRFPGWWVHQKRSQPDARPRPAAPHYDGRQRQTARRPHGRDARVRERQQQAQLRHSEVRSGHQSDAHEVPTNPPRARTDRQLSRRHVTMVTESARRRQRNRLALRGSHSPALA